MRARAEQTKTGKGWKVVVLVDGGEYFLYPRKLQPQRQKMLCETVAHELNYLPELVFELRQKIAKLQRRKRHGDPDPRP